MGKDIDATDQVEVAEVLFQESVCDHEVVLQEAVYLNDRGYHTVCGLEQDRTVESVSICFPNSNVLVSPLLSARIMECVLEDFDTSHSMRRIVQRGLLYSHLTHVVVGIKSC